MKEYELVIPANGGNCVDFSPPSVRAEILQNIRTIITTPKYSVPLFREFGLDETLTDSPMNIAGSKLKSDIIMAVRKYEPRASVTHIEIVPDNNGRLSFRLRIRIPSQEG